MFGGLQCTLTGHKINRRKVWHDGLDHRASCVRCGTPMLNRNHAWRQFDTDEDTDMRRKPHPNYDQVVA